MKKDEARGKIEKLVEKYTSLSSQELNGYSEEETKKDFILPLFEALGWDIADKKEVSAEEHIKSSGWVDYGFYLNGHAQFYLEAKAFKVDLHKEEFAKQAIRYSWNKGATWAILTNFERIKVFNAQDIEKSLAGKLYFEIPCEQFLERFDQLWLLSKEAFGENLIDIEAEKIGKKYQRIPISSLLYKDLSECRNILTKDLSSWNDIKDKNLLDEGVQKLLDRLIFIRVAEDRGVEDKILMPLVRQWENNKNRNEVPIYKSMVEKFREFDKTYNSNLFTEHPFENWEEYGGATQKVIKILYGKEGYYEYDFKIMPADVLGSVYENYLGHRLSQSKKGIAIDKDAKKRKEHGIYYTPSFIVDYIVKNALQPVLDNCHSISDLKKIKVLDPACGSGSFLIKVLDLIHEKYKSFNSPGGVLTKIQILMENIYGVDLDPQAVEIARLNLLINSLDSKMKFPPLTANIKNGNSLISGSDEELKKYFGKNYRDKKPFNWEEEFPEVFKQGGFDVIIGNPPYGAEISNEEVRFFKDKYNIGSTDTAILFIKKSLTEIKKEGFLGFIVPKAFCFASNYGKIRDLVWDDLNTVVDCNKVWHEVKLEQIIIILQKDMDCKIYKSGVVKDNSIIIGESIKKQIAKSFGFFLNGLSEKEIKIGLKIFQSGAFLGNFIKNKRGVILNKFIEHGKYPVIGCKEINRYRIKNIRGHIDENLLKTAAEINKDSVLVQGIVAHIENPVDHIKITANIPDSTEYFIADNINQITPDKDFSKYFIWAFLNSQLMNWYCYRFIYGKSIRTMRFDNPVTDRIPIPKNVAKKQEVIIKFSKELLKLHRELQKIEEDSNKYNFIKSEIAKTDRKIDEEVYKLYGLTEEEIRIVEG